MSLDVNPDPAPDTLAPAAPAAGAGPSRELGPAPQSAPDLGDPLAASSRSLAAVALSLTPEAASAFGSVQHAEGLDAALQRLQDGAFGTPEAGSPLSLAALVGGIRAENGLPALDTPTAGDGTATPTGNIELAQTRFGALNWVLGVLQGDFNDDPSLSQTVVGAVLSAIPGIDQLADARDVVANAINILENPRDTWAWIGGSLAAVGLVPTAGSLAKGAAKVALQTDDAVSIGRVIAGLGVDDPGAFLSRNVLGAVQGSRDTFYDTLENLAGALDRVPGSIPQLAGASDTLRSMRSVDNGSFSRAVDYMESRISYVANKVPKVGNPENATRAMADAGLRQARTFTYGSNEVILNRDGMGHILRDHHPLYFDASNRTGKDLTTFFNRDQGVGEIMSIAKNVLDQNASGVRALSGGSQQFSATVNGVQYTVGVRRAAGGDTNQFVIGQMFPHDPMR